ncbi:peptide-N-glycosidase F-related protein [Sandaracinus amylolyticus]|uniref:peptide-N-glycosidase F-related protein n=1 Tax=Sandaracinus amylolyticus TaxID=927083 RepID=UPI001F33B964|nr:peptide-N-glycosidase F-related protein [Sandaracinus amylolyticus]UJR83965.1 Hypothetical protein I5071_60360 [Sandaracinus amylolyticus]
MLARTTSRALLLSTLLALVGCGDDDASTQLDAGLDASTGDAGSDGGPPASALCDELDLQRTPMRTSGFGDAPGELAGDFTVTQLDGSTWTLSERWSGCESYVFLVHFPGASGDALFATSIARLFSEGPRNTRYFFLSYDENADARRARMDALRTTFEDDLGFWLEGQPEQHAFWRERMHFVTDRATEVQGSVGAHLRSLIEFASTPGNEVDHPDHGRIGVPAPVAFGIDRAQTWDEADNLAPSVGRPPELGMAAFLGHFYEYRAALDARLASETDATIVTLLDERTAGRVFRPEVTLPDAATMASFDQLEIDIEITCDEGNPFACSEWDRIADIQICTGASADPVEACEQRLEIARWITPYWRRGRQRYAIDATPFLALMREGGARRFFVELGPEWERATEWLAKVSLRFRNVGGTPRATGGARAFVGGGFDAAYNTREPFTFTPPAGATRVELVTILSGHGQTDGDNCAEWCDHRHVFTVNGTALPEIRHEGGIGEDVGCAVRASEGVIPGQWGNWAQSRAYWCPGLPVDAVRTDITSQVTLGAENTITYAGRFRTGEPRGGDIALSAYVVWYAE